MICRSGRCSFNFTDTVDAGHLRQLDVHQHDIRSQSRYLGERSFCIGVCCNTTMARRAVDQHGKTLPDLIFVFDNCDTNGHDIRYAIHIHDIMNPAGVQYSKWSNRAQGLAGFSP